MKQSSRIYSCTFCLKQVVICSHCDRGNIYCGPICAGTARQKYCKTSNKRYQQTQQGKFNNALRQKRFRERKNKKVTDHGSQNTPQHVLLSKVKNNAIKNVIKQNTNDIRCCICNNIVSDWLRYDFLRYYTKQKIKKLRYSKPP